MCNIFSDHFHIWFALATEEVLIWKDRKSGRYLLVSPEGARPHSLDNGAGLPLGFCMSRGRVRHVNHHIFVQVENILKQLCNKRQRLRPRILWYIRCLAVWSPHSAFHVHTLSLQIWHFYLKFTDCSLKTHYIAWARCQTGFRVGYLGCCRILSRSKVMRCCWQWQCFVHRKPPKHSSCKPLKHWEPIKMI